MVRVASLAMLFTLLVTSALAAPSVAAPADLEARAQCAGDCSKAKAVSLETSLSILQTSCFTLQHQTTNMLLRGIGL